MRRRESWPERLQNTVATCLFFVAISSASAGAGEPAPALEVETWEGRVLAAGNLALEGTALAVGPEKVPLADVMEIRVLPNTNASDGTQGELVGLLDGSVHAGTLAPGLAPGTLHLELAHGGNLEVAKTDLAFLRFHDLEPGVTAADVPPGPCAILRNGKVLPCEFDFITFLDVGVKAAGAALQFKREELARLELSTPAGLPQEGVVVNSVRGARVIGKLLSLKKGDVAVQNTRAETFEIGLQNVRGAISFRCSEIRALEFLSKKRRSLLELKPAAVVETPLFDFIRKTRFDASLFGDTLQASEHYFQRGIGVHSKSEIRYKLGKEYRRFVSWVGFDTRLTRVGKAVFRVRGDGKLLAEQPLAASDGLKRLRADVAGVDELTLELDFGDDDSAGDHGVWGDPLLIR